MVSYIRSQITIKKGPLLRKGLEKLWKLFKYPIYLEYMKLWSQLVECLSPIAILTIPCSKKSIQLVHDASQRSRDLILVIQHCFCNKAKIFGPANMIFIWPRVFYPPPPHKSHIKIIYRKKELKKYFLNFHFFRLITYIRCNFIIPHFFFWDIHHKLRLFKFQSQSKKGGCQNIH